MIGRGEGRRGRNARPGDARRSRTASATIRWLLLAAALAVLPQCARHSTPSAVRLRWTPVTTGRGPVSAARFSRDGATVLYATSPVAGRPELFETQPESGAVSRRVPDRAPWEPEWPRRSPDGRRVAVSEALPPPGSGACAVIRDDHGRVEARSAPHPRLSVGAWRADGRELWFCTGTDTSETELWSLTPDGRERLVARLPGCVTLQDVDRRGRALVVRTCRHTGIRARGPLPGSERELGWGHRSRAADISADGRTLLLSAEDPGGLPGVYVRGMDGSPAVRIGSGQAVGLSPDGKWALALQGGASGRLVLLPLRGSDSLVLPRGGIESYRRARWVPDGRTVLFVGIEPGRVARTYVQDVAGGAPRPITPEGVATRLVSPDGSRIAFVAGERYCVRPLGGGRARVVADHQSGETPVLWASDGGALFVERVESASCLQVSRLDLRTGRRTPWRTLQIADPAGYYAGEGVALSPDGRSSALNYALDRGALYLVEGLR